MGVATADLRLRHHGIQHFLLKGEGLATLVNDDEFNVVARQQRALVVGHGEERIERHRPIGRIGPGVVPFVVVPDVTEGAVPCDVVVTEDLGSVEVLAIDVRGCRFHRDGVQDDHLGSRCDQFAAAVDVFVGDFHKLHPFVGPVVDDTKRDLAFGLTGSHDHFVERIAVVQAQNRRARQPQVQGVEQIRFHFGTDDGETGVIAPFDDDGVDHGFLAVHRHDGFVVGRPFAKGERLAVGVVEDRRQPHRFLIGNEVLEPAG